MSPAERHNPQISDAEREVLKALWELDAGTVQKIREALQLRGRTWARTTINTLLTRMEEKGLVRRDTSGFAHLYRAAISRNKIVQQRLAALSNDYCDGASVPLMLTLLESQRFTESEIDAFRQLIDKLEKQTPSEHAGKKHISKRRHRRKG